MMSSAWRYIFDVSVVILSLMAVVITGTILRPPHHAVRRWVPHVAAWIGSVMLTVRGVAGMIVDGTSDPIWWPTFLLGGILLGSVAWLARVPEAGRVPPQSG
jgi:hypothetical protein